MRSFARTEHMVEWSRRRWCRIVNEAPDDSPIRDVVLLLGSFHTLMNLLGAIGTVMDGSGLTDILQTIYSENAVVHMMSGKAVQRSIRGHLLVSQCLTQQIAGKVIQSEPGFDNLCQKLERLYTCLEVGEIDLETLLKSDCIEGIKKGLISKKNELSNVSETSKLWINYLKMLETARKLIEADRTGRGTCISMLYLSAYQYLLLQHTLIILNLLICTCKT